MFAKILIANRGEIACRIARTCRRMAIPVATVHSTADAGGLHVREIGESILIGDGPARDSYLRIDRVLEAAEQVGADAVHPGIGFLSESADFAAAVEGAGLAFIGPRPETLARFADKGSAKQEAIAAGLPVVPGAEEKSDDPADLRRLALETGLPILLKAAGGGGGRGLRVVTDPGDLDTAIEAAQREAESAFHSAGLIVEQYLDRVRHIEVQILGDGDGDVVHLLERVCSLQRRHQKVIEEAPAANLDADLRTAILEDACQIGRRAKYRGAGTVEFIVKGDRHYFLEVNPRLQVEHPVTEALTGVDLVEMQIRIAAGEGLPVRQDDIQARGHAIEARIYAEDAAAGFVPSTGTIRHLDLPGGDIRVEAGVEAGDTISPFYDPMIAKLIVHDDNRSAAIQRLEAALGRIAVTGITANISFLSWLMSLPEFLDGIAYTRLIDDRLADYTDRHRAPPKEHLAAAAYLWIMRHRPENDPNPWHRGDRFSGWRLSTGPIEPSPVPTVLLGANGRSIPVHSSPLGADGRMAMRIDETTMTLSISRLGDDQYRLTTGGRALVIQGHAEAGHVSIASPLGKDDFSATPYLIEAGGADAAADAVVSPMMGAILTVLVAEGDDVAAGQTLAVLDSMKMEIPIQATANARIAKIACAPGDMVERNQVLMTMEAGGG